jgi:exonuclease V
MQSTQEWKRKREEGKIIKKRNQAMEAGSSIHYRREIEVHDVPIPVATNTKEDKLAVDLINMYIKLAGVKEGNLGREVKVTGLPFNEGMVLITGVIDQIQYCPAENSLIILELKTRTTFSLPSDEQKRGAALQLMLYKSLLDAWTQGMVDGRRMLLDMGLKLSQKLTLGVISYIYTMGLDGVLLNYGPVSIEELTHRIIELVVNMRLPMVDTLLVQYEYQKRGAIVGIESIIYDEEWAKKGLTNNLQYWLGVRAADGVDIEDSWKCQTCQYHDVCVKRKRQVAETSPVKKWPTNF